jgi:hypothetical protein
MTRSALFSQTTIAQTAAASRLHSTPCTTTARKHAGHAPKQLRQGYQITMPKCGTDLACGQADASALLGSTHSAISPFMSLSWPELGRSKQGKKAHQSLRPLGITVTTIARNTAV